MKKKNFHLPKYWFYMLILSFVILSVMPLMAGFLVNLIANGEEGKIRFLQIGELVTDALSLRVPQDGLTLEGILEADRAAREFVRSRV